MFTLAPGARIIRCIDPWLEARPEVDIVPLPGCEQCSDVPYRLLLIQADNAADRGLLLCGRHFLQAERHYYIPASGESEPQPFSASSERNDEARPR